MHRHPKHNREQKPCPNTHDMQNLIKHTVAILAIIIYPAIGTWAQTSMEGQTFRNDNVILTSQDAMKKRVQEAISKKEAEWGRKATKTDSIEVAKAVINSLKPEEMIQLIATTSISMQFLPKSKVKMSMKLHAKEEIINKSRMGWMQRQMLKSILAMGSHSEKQEYIRKGNMIIVSPKSEPDTMMLSPDGKTLSSKTEEGLPYTLTRQ